VAVDAGMGYAAAAAAYLLLMGAGTAMGGLFWQIWVLGPAHAQAAGAATDVYRCRQIELFGRVEGWALAAALLGLAGLAPGYLAAPGLVSAAGERWGLAVAAALLVLWAASLRRRRSARAGQGALAAGLAATTGLLAMAGFLQVWYQAPGDLGLLAWRTLHLLAFGAWFGGALWNVNIAVRAAREDLSTPVVILAHLQLERFRAVVRVALPLILLTGLLQLHDFFGWNAAAATSGLFGHLILVKLGLIGLLVVIFNTCPMWHACSPIAGMCVLDDLPGSNKEAAQR